MFHILGIAEIDRGCHQFVFQVLLLTLQLELPEKVHLTLGPDQIFVHSHKIHVQCCKIIISPDSVDKGDIGRCVKFVFRFVRIEPECYCQRIIPRHLHGFRSLHGCEIEFSRVQGDVIGDKIETERIHLFRLLVKQHHWQTVIGIHLLQLHTADASALGRESHPVPVILNRNVRHIRQRFGSFGKSGETAGFLLIGHSAR